MFFGNGQQFKLTFFEHNLKTTSSGTAFFKTSDTAIFLRVTSLGVIGEAFRTVAANIVTSTCAFDHMVNLINLIEQQRRRLTKSSISYAS